MPEQDMVAEHSQDGEIPEHGHRIILAGAVIMLEL